MICYKPTWIDFWIDSVNNVTLLAKYVTVLCMITGNFMIHSGHVENICPPWSFGLICIINVSFTTLLSRFMGWCMAMFRSLFFLLTFPEGVFQCDRIDWWLLPQWLTSQGVCGDSFIAHGILGTFPTTFILFPPCFLLFWRRSLSLLSYFIWLCFIKYYSWIDFKYYILFSASLYVILQALCMNLFMWLFGFGCISRFCLWVILTTILQCWILGVLNTSLFVVEDDEMLLYCCVNSYNLSVLQFAALYVCAMWIYWIVSVDFFHLYYSFPCAWF